MSEHDPRNEGEGSRSAGERYREGVKRTVERGDAERRAEDARREVDANPGEYREAEEAGRARSAGELDADLEGGERP